MFTKQLVIVRLRSNKKTCDADEVGTETLCLASNSSCHELTALPFFFAEIAFETANCKVRSDEYLLQKAERMFISQSLM